MIVSYWALLPVGLLAVVACLMMAIVDRRIVRRFLRLALGVVFQLMCVAALCWALLSAAVWVAIVLGVVASVMWCAVHLREFNLRRLAMLFIVSVAGAAIGSLCCITMLHSMPLGKVLVVSAMVFMILLVSSLEKALMTFESSMRRTAAHRLYLKANGATSLETVVPSVRRALRAALLRLLRSRQASLAAVVPVVFLALLFAGFSLGVAFISSLFLLVSAVSVAVPCVCLELFLFQKYIIKMS